MTTLQPTHSSRPPASAVSGSLLSHHAIMALVRPFSRKGYTLDLAASDRGRGVLAFQPTDLPEAPNGRPALRCELRLERVHRAKLRVIRTLQAEDGQTATMTADGDQPEGLLEAVEQVDPDRQFQVIERRSEADGADGDPVRLLVVRSYRTEVWSADAARRRRWVGKTATPTLIKTEARLGPLRLSAVDKDGRTFEVKLSAEIGYAFDVPKDFLAVLGWCWRPLRRDHENTWLCSVKVTRREPRRTAMLEAQLDTAAEHIVDTLGASPVLFHRRHLGARWRAAFQRLLPLLYISAMVAGFVLALMYLPKTAAIHMLLTKASILGVAAIWMLDKAYRVEIPPRPCPLKQQEWGGRLSEVR